jgi:hypothetical protein
LLLELAVRARQRARGQLDQRLIEAGAIRSGLAEIVGVAFQAQLKRKAHSFLLSVRHSHGAFGRACPIRYPSGRPENPRQSFRS